MSSSTSSPNISTQNPAMAVPSSQPAQLRRAKLSHVQTSLPTIPSTSVPASAISTSSVTSSSQQPSPAMSPQTTQITTNNSSIQGSPEGLRGRDDDVAPPPFELPESIVSRKSSQSAMSEAVAISKSPGIIRRLSNRASQFGRRRQSSTTANSRDHSSGPVVRRRSDSNSTAPEIKGSFYSDSENELDETHLDLNTTTNSGDLTRDCSSGSATGSQSGDNSTGPVIPSVLLQGINMVKVSKKKKKTLTLILDMDTAKVSWDKTKPWKSFYIDDIKDIRFGANARTYRQEFGLPTEDEPRFFSIHYAVPDKSKGRSQKVMHLLGGDSLVAELWTTTLDAISKHRHEFMMSLSSFNDKAVGAYWRREMNKKFADKAHSEDDEEIDLIGVERLCRNLHIYASYNYLCVKFAQADTTQTGHLNFSEFQEFVKLMKRREDIRALYREIASNSEKGITLEVFLDFLREIQCEDVDKNRSHWEMVFAKFVRRSKTKEQAQQDTLDGELPIMSETALVSFLTSTFNVPLAQIPAQFSLDRPLHEYYISSSHNTYLLGRQVAGQSSVEAYVSALSRGCRCVEVDCWNGASGPVVMHGRTLTTQVSFSDVMTTINHYAFVKTPFPLIISLEVHCSRDQQAVMSQIIRETFGDKLVTVPIDANLSELPSPSQLLNRILIKVKAPGEDDEWSPPDSSSGRRRGTSLNSPYVRPMVLDNASIPQMSQSPPMSPHVRATKVRPKTQMRHAMGAESQDSLSSSTSESESINDDIIKTSEGTQKRSQSHITKILGELGVYAAGLKFHGFDTPQSKTYNHVFSFKEQTFATHSKTHEDRRALARHNMKHLMRVYPNGWRVASTNFDPLTYWRRGVQMAALNWQTHDLGMQINDAMFAAGPDLSGYVLKPSSLRETKMIKNIPDAAGSEQAKRERQNVNFSVDIISAQQLMRPKQLSSARTFDPYVEVEVYHADDKGKDTKGVVGEGGLDASARDGSSGLGAPHRRRTQIVQDNGFNPLFDKKFNFDLTTKYPELVFVRWTVRASRDGHNYDEKCPILAVYVAKLSSLKQGYRTIPLMDSNGDQFLFSTLFCRIKIEPTTSIYISKPESPESIGKLKSIGRSVFRTQTSPKTSVESGNQ